MQKIRHCHQSASFLDLSQKFWFQDKVLWETSLFLEAWSGPLVVCELVCLNYKV